MKRPLLFLAALTSFTIALQAAPTPTPSANRTLTKSARTSGVREKLVESANGWSYIKGEWVHPYGYKYVKGKILRTTARAGKQFPKPPGKLALENAQKLSPTTKTASDPAKTAAETAAETRRRNLQPKPAPQTGTHL